MKSDEASWALPPEARPDPACLDFDLDEALSAMMWLSVSVPEEAYTAPILGTERIGNGCVIGEDGLVLTVGYLITEAQTIWITDHRGRTVPGHALGVDSAIGLGLVLPAMPLDTPVMRPRSQRRGGHRLRAGGARSRRHRPRIGRQVGRAQDLRRLLGIRARRRALHDSGSSALER